MPTTGYDKRAHADSAPPRCSSSELCGCGIFSAPTLTQSNKSICVGVSPAAPDRSNNTTPTIRSDECRSDSRRIHSGLQAFEPRHWKREDVSSKKQISSTRVDAVRECRSDSRYGLQGAHITVKRLSRIPSRPRTCPEEGEGIDNVLSLLYLIIASQQIHQ